MPRGQSNNADYYPHRTTMRNHRKVKMLRNKFGQVVGYAFWSMMLEWLTEQDGTEWEFSEIEIEMFASELGVSAAEIPPMVEFCLKIELLFLSNDNFIYSDSLNDALNPVFEKRKKEREKSQARKRKEDGTFKIAKSTTRRGVSAAETTTNMDVSASDLPQSRVEYSKYILSKDSIVGLPEATTTGSVTYEEKCRQFIDKFNQVKKSKHQVTDTVRNKLKVRLKDYTGKQIIEALKNAMSDAYHKENNFKHLTPEFMLRADKIDKFLNSPPVKPVESEPSTQTINHNSRK